MIEERKKLILENKKNFGWKTQRFMEEKKTHYLKNKANKL